MSTTQSDSPLDPHDVCECGHLRGSHRTASCLAYVPAQPLQGMSGLDPIECATELPIKSKAKGSPHDWTSSICACSGFRPSGLRFMPDPDPLQRSLVQSGNARRTLVEVATLAE